MRIERVSEENILQAAKIHAAAWRESHRSICSDAFIAAHTTERQTEYIRNAMSQGCSFYILTDKEPVAVVSVNCSLIADLYVHPAHQRKATGRSCLNTPFRNVKRIRHCGC